MIRKSREKFDLKIGIAHIIFIITTRTHIFHLIGSETDTTAISRESGRCGDTTGWTGIIVSELETSIFSKRDSFSFIGEREGSTLRDIEFSLHKGCWTGGLEFKLDVIIGTVDTFTDVIVNGSGLTGIGESHTRTEKILRHNWIFYYMVKRFL